ncbi:AAA family ATPase [Chloroflexota bacterium]
MAIYQWAKQNGEIVEQDYDGDNDTLSSDQVKTELINALNQFGHNVSIHQVNTDLGEVYEVTIPNHPGLESIMVSIKETTPGGRDTLKDEQRIQQKSKYINYAYEQQQAGKLSVLLGVYKRDGETIFCAWKLKHSDSSPETGISKQIKITSIADAMREGFVQQDKGGGEFACAFRKEFIYFYIQNSHWLHNGAVSELSEHTIPLPETTRLEGSLRDKYNRIIFGAPGTGKSYNLEQNRISYFDNNHYERVTFHPNYSYAQFVGTYKPVKVGEDITYKYVPGPFIRVFIKAMLNPDECQLLLIEEINRANVAAVFGDAFQLLDRKEGISEYPVEPSEDLKSYLLSEFGEKTLSAGKIVIPSNMYIWATMNSADQGVFPVDTAFKRRWDFEYLGIDKGSEVIKDYSVEIASLGYKVYWDQLRKAINKILSETCRINEDKLIGPFFISINTLSDRDAFDFAFKSKVLMYLYEDAARQHRSQLFSGCTHFTYSDVVREYDLKGEAIFNLSLAIKEEVVASENNEEPEAPSTGD